MKEPTVTIWIPRDRMDPALLAPLRSALARQQRQGAVHMTDAAIERRVNRLEEDGAAVQESVSKLLETTTDVQRHVRRMVEQGIAHRARLGQVEVAIGGLREGQRAVEDHLDQVNEHLRGLEQTVSTLNAGVTEILNRLPSKETP